MDSLPVELYLYIAVDLKTYRALVFAIPAFGRYSLHNRSLIITKYVTKHTYRNYVKYTIGDNPCGMLHREDGPAIEFTNGTKWWYREGKLHRGGDQGEALPAIESNDGYKAWYRNGRLHRDNDIDGTARPAIMQPGGIQSFYDDGLFIKVVYQDS